MIFNSPAALLWIYTDPTAMVAVFKIAWHLFPIQTPPAED
jgi:hypothetical protein